MARTLLIDDAARLLGVSRRTVYYRIRDGQLLTIRTKCGSQRVFLSSIQRLLQGTQNRTPVADASPATASSDQEARNPAMGTGC